MASGSRKWMLYTSDDGSRYAVNIDEGNGEALGFDDYTAGVGESGNVLPRGFQMRYVNATTATGIRRRFWVGKPDNEVYTGAAPSVTIDGVTYNVSSTRGEKKTRPVAFDTAQQDGDAT